MEYYFVPWKNINETDEYLNIEGNEYKHLTKVLRKRIGDIISVTDGNYNIFTCKIKEISKAEISCKILKKEINLFEPERKVHIYLSLLKSFERLEFAIEKAVELGVHEITLLSTKYSVLKDKLSENKIERLKKIIISAMSQSQRCFLPRINNTISFQVLLQLNNSFEKIVMYEFAEKTQLIQKEKIDNNEITLLIGPEGGFSVEEINQLVSKNWKVLSLGERKLRAETAAIVSLYEILNKH